LVTIAAIGDVIGKPGRRCLEAFLPNLRAKFQPDIITANGENLAGGFGLTKKIFDEMITKLQIDCMTMGNHWADKREINEFFAGEEKLILPANAFNVSSERDGFTILQTKSQASYCVINVIGRVFMHQGNRCPFKAMDVILDQIPAHVKIRILDIHGEASSEKQALARYVMGKVSLVYGTHCHVPTADERILGGHTGYITDLGMTGAYESIIGMRENQALHRFLTGEKKSLEPAKGDPWLCFIVAKIDPSTGQCTSIERFRWEQEKIAEMVF
jgi:metallophosphoesterase (TIGR00282 family)